MAVDYSKWYGTLTSALAQVKADRDALQAQLNAYGAKPSLVPGYLGGTGSDASMQLTTQISIAQKNALLSGLQTLKIQADNWKLNDVAGYQSRGLTQKPFPTPSAIVTAAFPALLPLPAPAAKPVPPSPLSLPNPKPAVLLRQAIPNTKAAVTKATGSAPVSATLHPPQATAGPGAQPNKQNGTVEPLSVPTAQRDGSGTLQSGPKTVTTQILGDAVMRSNAIMSPDNPDPSIAATSSNAGAASRGSAAVSELFAGMGFWFHDPGQAAQDIQPAVTSLGNPALRYRAIGLLLLPMLVLYTIYQAIK